MSLRLIERGFWDELIDLAKHNGDTGFLSFHSWSALGAAMGCDGKTCRKIAGKFRQDGKIKCYVGDGAGTFAGNFPEGKIPAGKILVIFIVNYIKNQRDKKASDPPVTGKIPQTSPSYISKVDKNKEDISPAPKNPAHKRIVDYFCQEYEKKFEEKYSFKGGKDGDLIKRLLSQWGEEKLKALIDRLFITEDEFLSESGRTIGVLSACDNQLAQELKTGGKSEYERRLEAAGDI